MKNVKLYGLFDFQKMPDVKIQFFKPFDKPMSEKYEHTEGAIIARDEESVTVHLHDLTEYESAQLIMNCCGNAKVLEPASLKDYLRRIANKILENLQS